eukprot:12102727-Karenia_brevis.AAC.1
MGCHDAKTSEGSGRAWGAFVLSGEGRGRAGLAPPVSLCTLSASVRAFGAPALSGTGCMWPC